MGRFIRGRRGSEKGQERECGGLTDTLKTCNCFFLGRLDAGHCAS